MSALLKLISEWKNGRKSEDCDFRDLFKEHLHKEPYFLRYSLDKQRPNLFMIYITDMSDRNNELVQECNGIILDRSDYSVVAFGMKRMKDLTEQFHRGDVEISFDDYKLEESEDGAVLTVYNYDNIWMVSTKRSIDAKNVKWSSQRNFYQLLSDAFVDGKPDEMFSRDLEKEFTYSFILLHPENHLVIQHSKPELVYVSRRSLKTLKEDNIASVDEASVPALEWAGVRSSLDKTVAEDRLKRKNGNNYNKRGVIFSRLSQSGDYERSYVDYKWFQEANLLRHGKPSLHLSYLACGPDEKQKMRQYFGNQNIFNVIDDLLRNLTRYIFSVYKDSYVRKQFKVPNNSPIYRTIRKLHYDYKTTGEPVRIHHVVNAIDNIPPEVLDGILLHYSTYGFYAPVNALVQNAGASRIDGGKNENESSQNLEKEEIIEFDNGEQ